MEGVDDKIAKAYFNYMIDVATILGANRSRAEKELRESLQFEIKLAEVIIFCVTFSVGIFYNFFKCQFFGSNGTKKFNEYLGI